MDHHNSNPFCSKVNYTQFPTFRAVNLKGVKSVYKKVCQSSLTMPSSSPPNVFKTLNYLKEKEEDGWININPICETTQPFKNESQTAMNQLRENVILLIQVLSIHTSEMTWSFETIPHWAWQTVLCCWIPVKCQLQAKDGITSWRDRKKKKKTGHLSLKVCIRTHPKSPSQMLWSNPEVFTRSQNSHSHSVVTKVSWTTPCLI